nr:MAG TPA: translocation protein [Bacteriophage sp.]
MRHTTAEELKAGLMISAVSMKMTRQEQKREYTLRR